MFIPIPPETPRDRARFDAKWVETPEGCHRWTSFFRSKEYGGFQIGYRTYRAHRVIYVWTHGEPNCDLDHACENAWCVNPEHLTPASAGQPRHRNANPSLCARGHEFTEENTYVNPRGERQCRTCLRAATERHYEANREKVNAKKRAARVRVVHTSQPCARCGTVMPPKQRSTGRFCDKADNPGCFKARMRENRLRRMGR